MKFRRVVRNGLTGRNCLTGRIAATFYSTFAIRAMSLISSLIYRSLANQLQGSICILESKYQLAIMYFIFKSMYYWYFTKNHARHAALYKR